MTESPPEPADLAAQLPAWITEARDLARQVSAAPLIDELDLLARQLDRPHLRLAAVGEFNRGKSTLVNRLTDTNLLPVGPVPTTRSLVIVGYGDPASLVVSLPDGVVQTRTDAAALWAGLTDDGPQPDELRLAVPSTWLRDLGVEILDTPGANETLDDDSGTDVRRALLLADAALLIVSAAAGIGRTELTMLEAEIVRRRIPLAAVVVARVDQLEAEDRDAALAAVAAKVDRVAPDTAVLPGPGVAAGAGAAELAAIRERIEHVAAESTDRLWRAGKHAAALADIGTAIADIAGLAADAAEQADADRRASVDRERAALSRDTASWDELRAALEARRRVLAGRIRESLFAERRSLVADLHDALHAAEDPTVFWDRELRPLLRSRLVTLIEKTEMVMVDGLTADVAWLEAALADRFGLDAAPPRVDRPGLEAPRLPAVGQVGDIGLARVFAIIGQPLGKIIGELLGAFLKLSTLKTPIRVAGEGVGDLVGRDAIRAATDRVRRAADARLDPLVNDTLDRFADDVATRLDRLYADILDGLVHRRAAWREARTAALAGEIAIPADGPAPRLTADAAVDFVRRIRIALEAPTAPDASTTLTASTVASEPR